MRRAFLIMLASVALPAKADQKLFLSCTNGRSPETNAPFVEMPNFFPTNRPEMGVQRCTRCSNSGSLAMLAAMRGSAMI
jgi:hypothetical protein